MLEAPRGLLGIFSVLSLNFHNSSPAHSIVNGFLKLVYAWSEREREGGQNNINHGLLTSVPCCVLIKCSEWMDVFVCARVIRWCNIDIILFQKFTVLDSWKKYHSVGCTEICT